jgi:hypothetical protein
MVRYRQPLATQTRRLATALFPREIPASRDFLARIRAGLPGQASRDRSLTRLTHRHAPAQRVWRATAEWSRSGDAV